MQREYSLNTAAVSYTSNGESLVDSAVLLSDNGTLEYLNTELLAFLDLNVNLYEVADLDLGASAFMLPCSMSFNASIIFLLIFRTFLITTYSIHKSAGKPDKQRTVRF